MLRKTLIAGVAVAAALSLAACGDDTSNADSTTSSKPTTTAAANDGIDYPPAPSAVELNAMLVKGLDPATPAAEKVTLVQDGESDPGLFDAVAAAAKQSNATVTVVDPILDNGDGTLTATVNMDIGGQVSAGTAGFVVENGQWKLSKEYACNIVKLANLTSPACV
ncbi:maltose-binding protein MalE [Rhodococcus sp. PvR044]